MAEQLKEDKLIVKNDNIVKKGAKDGWALIKIVCLVFYNTMQWFMLLENPNNAQAGFVSVVVGAGAAWFGLYVNGKKTDIKK